MTTTAVMKPERRLQPMFSKGKLFSSLVVMLPIFGFLLWQNGQPSRWPGPDRVVAGRAEAVAVGNVAGVAGATMRAWRLSAPDRRFGGLSALAIDRGAFIALTDSGVIVRFAPPVPANRLRIALRDLPDGPGRASRKAGRDSESLLADPRGRGWWVGFEFHHTMWLYDRDLRRVLARRALKVEWSSNRGAEALVAGSTGVMALPEDGGHAAGGTLIAPVGTSDATRLPDGRLVLLVRRFGLAGFDTRLWIAAGGGKPARRIALGLGKLDNMEGIAAVPLADGGTRLWIVSDDNFRPWMRTLLVAIDLPAAT